MKKIFEDIIKLLKNKGVDYADIRLVEQTIEKISTENMTIKEIIDSTSKGFGIRVIKDGYMGFACTQDINNLHETALKAYELSKSSTALNGSKIAMEKEKYNQIEDMYSTEIEIDPFVISKGKKIKFLFDIEKCMLNEADLYKTSTFMEFKRERKVYINTEGRYINQIFYISGIGIEAAAMSEDDIQFRTYPNTTLGNYEAAGYEYILSLDIEKNAKRIAREAEKLLKAENCPTGMFDIILDGSQLATQIHESIGHAVELDRILGWEADYTGCSFLNVDDIKNNFKYGSECITVVADATIPNGLGTFKYDDDGIEAQKITIINKGVLENFLTSCDTAKKINQKSNGTSRAQSWKNHAMIRMTNINLQAGKYRFNELVNEINYGLYLSTNKSWSIDDKRSNFQFACQIAYEIKDGEFTGRIFKNPIYSGKTIEFWLKCDGICNESYWKLYSITNCGKGNPMQVIQVSHGTSPARFRSVKVGV